MLKALFLDLNETLCDSLAADIAGAHYSGMTSVWIQHQQPLDAELGINPHHTLLHPGEIPALIRELHRN